MWSGSSSNIPNGWALCNGNNNTPDLRDKFVLGAGKNYTVGAMGGEKEVILTIAQISSHSHDIGNHTHDIVQYSDYRNGTNGISLEYAALLCSLLYNEIVKYYKSFKWCIFLTQGDYAMATNGILLGQNNNNEESLKKEVFFISDPITLHHTYGDKTHNSSFNWSLPEEAKKYSYINFGIYDGNISVLLNPPGNGSAEINIYFSCHSENFTIYNRKITSSDYANYKENFTFSKNKYGTLFLFTKNLLKPWANLMSYSYSSPLDAFSEFYLHSSIYLGNRADYVDLNMRFYLEGIK